MNPMIPKAYTTRANVESSSSQFDIDNKAQAAAKQIQVQKIVTVNACWCCLLLPKYPLDHMDKCSGWVIIKKIAKDTVRVPNHSGRRSMYVMRACKEILSMI